MTRIEALTLIGGLSETSKMPGKSYGLPTANCMTGHKLAQQPGTICSMCYANRGHYVTFAHAVLPAQNRRLASLSNPLWVDAMIIALATESWFRWNDSGDIQSVEHLDKIMQVAKRTFWCRHWLATRERKMLKIWLADNVVPENMVVRISATYSDVPVKFLTPLIVPGVCKSNVHNLKKPVGQECPAPKQFNKCDTCRACWDREIETISYHQH